MRRKLQSPLRRFMQCALIVSILFCVCFWALYAQFRCPWMVSCGVTFFTVAFHFLIRFLSPVLLAPVFHKQYRAESFWFRQKSWEPKFYRFLNVKQWKRHIPAYDPSEFSLADATPEEIINNMCHAEAVHELIIVLGFFSLFFSIPFDSFPVFLLTAIGAGCVDMVFVILQRYNRPRFLNLVEKRSTHFSKR